MFIEVDDWEDKALLEFTGEVFIKKRNGRVWMVKGKFHREDGPAEIYDDYQCWCFNGRAILDDGNAFCFEEVNCE